MEEEVKVEEETVEESPQAEPPTQLTEDRIKELISEARAEGKAEATEQYKGFQRTVSKTQRENAELKQRLEGLPAPQNTLTQELMVAELKQMDAENPRIAQLEQAIMLEKQKVEAQTRYNTQQSEARTERTKLEEQIEAAGFDIEDEAFEDVWDDWSVANKLDGDWSRPQRKLKRILKKQTPIPVAEKPDDTKEKAEAARKKAEEEGSLITETGSPSAGGMSNRQFMESYNRGDWDGRPDDYEKEARKRGII